MEIEVTAKPIFLEARVASGLLTPNLQPVGKRGPSWVFEWEADNCTGMQGFLTNLCRIEQQTPRCWNRYRALASFHMNYHLIFDHLVLVLMHTRPHFSRARTPREPEER